MILFELNTEALNTKIKAIFSKFSRKEANIMIPGGSILELLDQDYFNDLDGSRWTFYFSDERCDLDHLNYKDAERFLSYFKKSKVFPISFNKNQSYSKSAEEYNAILNEVDKIDFALLGVGENGHTCSIWPNALSIISEKYVTYTVVEDQFPKRITITPKFINEKISDIYFILPLKEGKPKKISKPDSSILNTISGKIVIYKASD